jgi:hypothetical protein
VASKNTNPNAKNPFSEGLNKEAVLLGVLIPVGVIILVVIFGFVLGPR